MVVCPRCQGLMAPYKSYDRLRTCWLWSCYICGELLDDTILYNRENSLPFKETRARNIDFDEKFLTVEEAHRLYNLDLGRFPSCFPAQPKKGNHKSGNTDPKANAAFFTKRPK